jgi:hypothetical protein
LLNETAPSKINSSTLSQKELTLLASYEEKVRVGKKMEEFSKAEVDAYVK